MSAGHGLFASCLEPLESSWQALADKPEENPETTLRALWFAAAGDPRSVQRIDSELPPLCDDARTRLLELVGERMKGVPLAHLTGRQSFLGLELLTSPAALIPRRETELLAESAFAKLREAVAERRSARVIDLCTGCGNIALVLAHWAPDATIFGADLSPAAVELARANADHTGLGDRVEFRVSDLFDAFDEASFHGTIDVVTCNPPYITSVKVDRLPEEIGRHEPRLAFDGGPFGMDIVLRVVTLAPRYLRPGGWLACEVGRGQGTFLAGRMRRSGSYDEVREIADAAGETRVMLGRTRSSS